MATVKCPDCGKEISDLAPTCIGCGRPMANQREVRPDAPSSGLFEHKVFKRSRGLILGFVGFALLASVALFYFQKHKESVREAEVAQAKLSLERELHLSMSYIIDLISGYTSDDVRKVCKAAGTYRRAYNLYQEDYGRAAWGEYSDRMVDKWAEANRLNWERLGEQTGVVGATDIQRRTYIARQLIDVHIPRRVDYMLRDSVCGRL